MPTKNKPTVKYKKIKITGPGGKPQEVHVTYPAHWKSHIPPKGDKIGNSSGRGRSRKKRRKKRRRSRKKRKYNRKTRRRRRKRKN